MLALRLAVLRPPRRRRPHRRAARHRAPQRPRCGSAQAPPRPRSSASAEVASAVPLLARVTPFIGHFQIRNRGTVGGSLAHADPAGRVPGRGARARRRARGAVAARGTRTIPAADVLHRPVEHRARAATSSSPASAFPVWSGRCGFAVEELARRHGDFAIAGAAVAVELDGDDRVAPLRHRPHRARLDARARDRGRGGRHRTAVAEVDRPTSSGAQAMAGLDDGARPTCTDRPTYRTRVGAVMVARAWTARDRGGPRWLRSRSGWRSTARRARRDGRAPADARRLPARAVRPHRHAPRLRARRLRRVHGARRRRRRARRASCSRCRPTAPRSPRSRASPSPDGDALARAGRRSATATASSAGSARPASSCRSPRCCATTPSPPTSEIREGLSGNLCRCTGYQGIIAAVRQAATGA